MPARERANALRQQMAYEAARIIVEQELSDFERARRKAAERTGILDRRNWPSNELIHEAVLAQRRLFSTQTHRDDLERMRRGALEAMRTFVRYSPRLVGNALSGAGGIEQGVQILLFAERPEDVVLDLIDQRIPWQDRERSFRYSGGERRTHPVLGFLAGDLPVELVVLPTGALRNPPLDPVSERPDRGADIEQVERLIEDEPPRAAWASA